MARRLPQPPSDGPGLFDAPDDAPPAARSPSPREAPAEPPTVSERRAPAADDPPPAAREVARGPRHATVSELTNDIKARLAAAGRVTVEGELSSVNKRTAGGHVYFDLKDESARLSCVVWRSQVSRALRFEPDEGTQVVATGKLDVYAPRGTYKLIVDELEPVGIGALLAEFEALKVELRERGWFERRRALPFLPRKVGVVTSRDGAALRDFLRTRSLRWPGYPVRLCHSAVQGPGAARDVASSIAALDASGVDLIVVCRGGGSLEDLWAFNELPVAEAIWNASVPVVTGVGHESDTTLADFVADHRAHTPTDAAQAVIPDRTALAAEVARLGNYLIEAMDTCVARRAERLEHLARRPSLRSAGWILGERARHVAAASARLSGAIERRLSSAAPLLSRLLARLERQSPARRLDGWASRLDALRARIVTGGQRRLDASQRRFELAAGRLESYSPLAVLARGYSVTTVAGSKQPLTEASDVAAGDELTTRLRSGTVVSRVVDARPEEA